MYLEIVSPETTLFKGDVESVSVPGVDGDFEMLNNHASVVSILKDGFVKIRGQIKIEESNISKFDKKDNSYWLAISSGTIEMNDNKIIVLAD
jgi:F-type H+-transporting ATPase subunit epsilon